VLCVVNRSPQESYALEKRKENLAAVGILAAIYFVAGKLGLTLAFVHPSATAVWPTTGIALAALLILGYRMWPGILLGAFFVNLATAGSILTSLGVATGNTLEALIGAYLVNRYAGGRDAFHSAQNTFKFAILAGLLSTTVAATFGVTSLSLGGYASWASYGSVWSTWWLGDAVGAVVIAPLLILWISDPHVHWNWARFAEFLALMVCLSVAAEIVFCGLFLARASNYPFEYLCIPFLVWAAFRFGQREAATATLVLSGIAIWGTWHGLGPFMRGTRNESLLLLQAFMGVAAVTTIALGAESAHRQRAEEKARHLAVTDPLTGLANYRKLIDVLDAEIKRFGRSGRSFAVLLLDLDGLKKINDRHGHLTGSRALCRLADTLRVHCRSIDTAARYGGDEFAIIIPEAGALEAQQVARRICKRVREDTERPSLSVSVGAAVYPRDGETIETVLAAADHALYEMKMRPRKEALLLVARGPRPDSIQ
jgi:diguanylate cyclase (GGDEF)-like protein